MPSRLIISCVKCHLPGALKGASGDDIVPVISPTGDSKTLSDLSNCSIAIYRHADGKDEHVQIRKILSDAEGGGFVVFIPSLQRERLVLELHSDKPTAAVRIPVRKSTHKHINT